MHKNCIKCDSILTCLNALAVIIRIFSISEHCLVDPNYKLASMSASKLNPTRLKRAIHAFNQTPEPWAIRLAQKIHRFGAMKASILFVIFTLLFTLVGSYLFRIAINDRANIEDLLVPFF